MARSTRRTGTVVAFDEDRGWGTVRADDGTEHWFHCTAVADGSRHIEVDAVVSYRVVAGRLGRWEATDLTPTGDLSSPARPR